MHVSPESSLLIDSNSSMTLRVKSHRVAWLSWTSIIEPVLLFIKSSEGPLHARYCAWGRDIMGDNTVLSQRFSQVDGNFKLCA